MKRQSLGGKLLRFLDFNNLHLHSHPLVTKATVTFTEDVTGLELKSWNFNELLQLDVASSTSGHGVLWPWDQ